MVHSVIFKIDICISLLHYNGGLDLDLIGHTNLYLWGHYKRPCQEQFFEVPKPHAPLWLLLQGISEDFYVLHVKELFWQSTKKLKLSATGSLSGDK